MNISIPAWLFWAIGLVLLAFTLIHPPRPSTEFYEDRDHLHLWRGELASEISKSESVWAAWVSGGSICRKHNFPWKKIKRLVLLSPKYPKLQELADEKYPLKAKSVKRDIIETTKVAQMNGVEVVWHKDTFDPMVLSNPGGGRHSWVRIESLGSRFVTNYIIPGSRKRLFGEARDKYEALFAASEPPSDVQ